MASKLLKTTFLIFCIGFSSCGYNWQGRGNPWNAQNVEKIYIKMLANNSLTPGVETVFTSDLIKEFSRGARLKTVTDMGEADAYVEGTVDSIGAEINATSTVPQIAPDDPQSVHFSEYVIATEYAATASITVRLIRKRDKSVLWQQSFSQKKLYPGNNRLGMVGNTSMLINDSQQQMAISEISRSLANDAYDTLLEAF